MEKEIKEIISAYEKADKEAAKIFEHIGAYPDMSEYMAASGEAAGLAKALKILGVDVK